MNEHHPSCRPSDRDLVWLCAQCGVHESAGDIEAENAKLRELTKQMVETVYNVVFNDEQPVEVLPNLLQCMVDEALSPEAKP